MLDSSPREGWLRENGSPASLCPESKYFNGRFFLVARAVEKPAKVWTLILFVPILFLSSEPGRKHGLYRFRRGSDRGHGFEALSGGDHRRRLRPHPVPLGLFLSLPGKSPRLDLDD